MSGLSRRALSALAVGDVEELCAHIDSMVLDGDWPNIVEVRDAARAAYSRGIQAWPAAAWAEYRMALEGPGQYAAMVLDSTAERFALGPFSEVAASTHTWHELAGHLEATPGAAAFAQERVLRGEDLRGEPLTQDFARLTNLPWSRAPWEPAWVGPTFHLGRIDEPPADSTAWPEPFLASVRSQEPPSSLAIAADRTVDALADAVAAWKVCEGASVRAVAIEGAGPSAAAFACGRTVEWTQVTAGYALSQLLWCAASGASGRRRPGGSSARAALWWALQCLAGLEDEDQVDSLEMGGLVDEVRWGTFSVGESSMAQELNAAGVETHGWHLRLTVEDLLDGFAWAVLAHVPPPRQGSLSMAPRK